MSLRPTRNQLLVENLPEELESEGGIKLLVAQGVLSRKFVLAVGPDVTDEVEEGDVVLVMGSRSGVDMGDGTYIISEEICMAVEKEG